jgi:hypothetical protein
MEKSTLLSNLPKFRDFVKYPLHVVLYLLLMYFAYKEFYKKDEIDELRKSLVTIEIKLEKAENDKDELTTALLVKNGIIDQIIKKNTDKVGNEAIKTIKK